MTDLLFAQKVSSVLAYPFSHNDFAPSSFYTEKHPDSRFAQVPMISIKKENDYRALYGNKLIRTKSGITQKHDIEDAGLKNVLTEIFNIKAPYCPKK